MWELSQQQIRIRAWVFALRSSYCSPWQLKITLRVWPEHDLPSLHLWPRDSSSKYSYMKSMRCPHHIFHRLWQAWSWWRRGRLTTLKHQSQCFDLDLRWLKFGTCRLLLVQHKNAWNKVRTRVDQFLCHLSLSFWCLYQDLSRQLPHHRNSIQLLRLQQEF